MHLTRDKDTMDGVPCHSLSVPSTDGFFLTVLYKQVASEVANNAIREGLPRAIPVPVVTPVSRDNQLTSSLHSFSVRKRRLADLTGPIIPRCRSGV